MNTTTMFAATAALAALLFAAPSALAAGPAADSAPMRLDLRESPRLAADGETFALAYSPRWGGAANCSITADGSRLLSNATDAGTLPWTARGVGRHALSFTAGALVYDAAFTVLGDDAVAIDGSRLQSNATWAAGKTWVVTAPLTVPSGITLTIESGAVVKFMDGAGLAVESGGACIARGVVFTHVADDTAGGDTMMDGDGGDGSPGTARPTMGAYTITGVVTDDDATEYRYMPPQLLTSSITSDTRLRGHRCYIVSNSVTVASGATLTLQPGTVIKFNTGCQMTVNGTLSAIGTRAAPIVFTSVKDDAHGGDTNGDGDKTYAQPGDWYQLRVSGTAAFDHCSVLYNASSENYGGLEAYGGTVTFDNGEIAHCKYECVNAHSSGTFTARNTAFRDGSLGFGYYGSGRVKAYNCVFWGLTTAIRQSGKQLVNCVFSDCRSFTDQGGDGSTFDHCVFWNPTGFGAQSYSKVGQNGNLWGDPLFLDPEGGDFRIAANSPCVDAADSAAAPELDFYGQPRMDVKRVADTGVPNGDGVCPDIGLYEVPGNAAVPLPDLAVVAVNAPAARCTVGEEIEISYVVTNRGAAAATGLVRDAFRLVGADAALAGLSADAGQTMQTYSLASGGAAAEMTARVRVPAARPGAWRVAVTANAERDIYESATANNSGESAEATSIALPSVAAGGSAEVAVPANGSTGVAVTGLPAEGGAIVAAALPAGMRLVAGVGYMPDAERFDAEGVQLADGRTAVFVPAHAGDDTVYAVLIDASGTARTVSLAALASTAGLAVAAPSDVAVTKKGPHVTAELVLPATVRDGRVYAAFVEYANDGDEDAPLPVFAVSRTSGGATFGTSPKGPFSAEALPLAGLAPSAPRGWLKPGEKGRAPFYLLSSGQMAVKLAVVTDDSSARYLNGFASAAEWRAGMAAAATRLAARGGADPDFSAILAQALNEKRGAGGAALCGTLRHETTRLPLEGIELHLVATNDDSVAAVALTDADGHFILAVDESGEYVVDVRDVSSQTPCMVSLDEGEDVQTTISAIPFSSISGFVERPDRFGVACSALVVLDNLATDDPEDNVAETDGTGRYAFAGVEDGEYRLTLYPLDGYTLVESEKFFVSNGVALVRNLAYGAKGSVVSGVVSDVETGEHVANAVVILSREGKNVGMTTDANGGFLFDGIESGRWGVSLQADAYQIDGAFDLVVEEGGQSADIPARAKCPFAVLRPMGMAPHKAAFAMVRDDATDLAWDFDGDGAADSSAEAPEWTYADAGTYTVALSYTDGDGIRRSSTWTDAVKVVEAFDNVLKANGVLVSDATGVTVESVSATELVLSGAAASAWTAPGTVLGAETSPKGGFIRRVVSAESLGGNRWRFNVEEARLSDLFERYFLSANIEFTETQARAAMAQRMASIGALVAKRAGGADEEVSHGAKVVIPERSPDHSFSLPTLTYTDPKNGAFSISLTGSVSSWNGDIVKGSYGAIVSDGVEKAWYTTRDTYQATITASGSYTKNFVESALGKKIRKTWNQSWFDIPCPFGFTLSLQTDEDLEFRVDGSGTVTLEQTARMRHTQRAFFEDGELSDSVTVDWGASMSTKRTVSGAISPTLDASLTIGLYGSWLKIFGRAGGGPKVGAEFSLSQNVEIGTDFSQFVGTGGPDIRLKGVADSRLEIGIKPYVGLNLSFKLFNVPAAGKWDKDLPIRAEWPNTASVGKMGIDVSGDKLTVNVTAKDPKIEASGWIFNNLLHLDGVEVPATGFEWTFGDGTRPFEGRTVSHTYYKAGKYRICLEGTCAVPTSLLSLTGNPLRRTVIRDVNVFDDRPPEPQETADEERRTPQQSCDPNEMDGPLGLGDPETERFLVPGEWATYTIYFENQTNATADAQQVVVDTALSPQLDWSTFEMLEVAFGDQADTGLAGKRNGTSSVDFGVSGRKVKTTVALNETVGSVLWTMRIWDSDREDYNYWPADDSGFLPPNDPDTHCGEGHITYRVKVRADAAPGARIDAAATIVFDYNDPIPTDPAWWNTVGALATPLPVHRFYSKAYKGHFFTISEDEKEDLIAHNPNWKYEGTAYRAYTNETAGTTKLYRFYSKNYRGHFFTIDAEEAEGVKLNRNWKYEGVAYYVYPTEVEGSVPVFRFWSKGYRHHFYTTNEAEKDNLIATNPNWKYEGVAFYALPEEESGKKASSARNAGAIQMEGATQADVSGRLDGADSTGDVRKDAKTGADGALGDRRGAHRASDARVSAPWTLVALPDARALAVPGVTEIGDAFAEARFEVPDADELAASLQAPFREGGGAGRRGENEPLALRLFLPSGAFRATLWNAADGAEEFTAEGTFDFVLPASGVWHWLRARDAEGQGEDAFSLWLRVE